MHERHGQNREYTHQNNPEINTEAVIGRRAAELIGGILVEPPNAPDNPRQLITDMLFGYDEANRPACESPLFQALAEQLKPHEEYDLNLIDGTSLTILNEVGDVALVRKTNPQARAASMRYNTLHGASFITLPQYSTGTFASLNGNQYICGGVGALGCWDIDQVNGYRRELLRELALLDATRRYENLNRFDDEAVCYFMVDEIELAARQVLAYDNSPSAIYNEGGLPHLLPLLARISNQSSPKGLNLDGGRLTFVQQTDRFSLQLEPYSEHTPAQRLDLLYRFKNNAEITPQDYALYRQAVLELRQAFAGL